MNKQISRKELTKQYFETRHKKEVLEAEVKELNAELTSIERSLIEVMGTEGLRNFTDDLYGMVYLEDRVYARIKDIERLKESLIANGLEDNIKETVSTSTLSSMASKDGLELEGAEYHYQTKIKIRRSK